MAKTTKGRRRKTSKNHAYKLHRPYDILAEPSAQIVSLDMEALNGLPTRCGPTASPADNVTRNGA